jgi:hypothetical protein
MMAKEQLISSGNRWATGCHDHYQWSLTKKNLKRIILGKPFTAIEQHPNTMSGRAKRTIFVIQSEHIGSCKSDFGGRTDSEGLS